MDKVEIVHEFLHGTRKFLVGEVTFIPEELARIFVEAGFVRNLTKNIVPSELKPEEPVKLSVEDISVLSQVL